MSCFLIDMELISMILKILFNQFPSFSVSIFTKSDKSEVSEISKHETEQNVQMLSITFNILIRIFKNNKCFHISLYC